MLECIDRCFPHLRYKNMQVLLWEVLFAFPIIEKQLFGGYVYAACGREPLSPGGQTQASRVCSKNSRVDSALRFRLMLEFRL